MKKLWKRNAVVAAILVFVCAAIFFNGRYASEMEKNSKVLGQSTLVDGTEGDGTVVVRTVYPTYRGALVVCQGGDRPEVKLAVTEAVAALTGLSADRVTVAKWQ